MTFVFCDIPQMRKAFTRAILVMRDPYPAIQAEFNRQSGGHIGHAQPDKYTRDHGRCKHTFIIYMKVDFS